MMNAFPEILDRFCLDSPALHWEKHGNGHINKTWLVTCESGRRYVLQRVGSQAFHDIPGLMRNMELVTEHLRSRCSDPRSVLCLLPTREGGSYVLHGGEYWRMFPYIENSICLSAAETPEDLYQCALAFGRFQQLLRDFPAEALTETIPHFHDTPDRYRIFREALEADVLGRFKEARTEVGFALAREQESSLLVNAHRSGLLPTCVTHNDTKMSNVLLDKSSRTALCVIDLDTVMPGLRLYDIGDTIRSGCATAEESEGDLSKVGLDLEKFRLCVRAYCAACPDLSREEKLWIPTGAKLMTLENGVRFLTDYLSGDKYFTISYPTQNLHRCRNQFALVADMEEKWEQMENIIKEEIKS